MKCESMSYCCLGPSRACVVDTWHRVVIRVLNPQPEYKNLLHISIPNDRRRNQVQIHERLCCHSIEQHDKWYAKNNAKSKNGKKRRIAADDDGCWLAVFSAVSEQAWWVARLIYSDIPVSSTLRRNDGGLCKVDFTGARFKISLALMIGKVWGCHRQTSSNLNANEARLNSSIHSHARFLV